MAQSKFQKKDAPYNLDVKEKRELKTRPMSTQTFRPQRTRSISSAPSKTMPSNRIIRLGRGRFFFILYFNSISFRFFSATNCWAMAAGCDDVETVALFFISGRFFFLQKQQQQQTTKPSNFIGQFDVETNQSAIHFQTLLWQHSRFSLANDGATNQSAPWKSSTRGRSNKRRTIYWSTTKK